MNIQEALDKLVTHGSEQQIVDYLADQGVQGLPRSTHACVISEYVQRETGIPVVTVPSAKDIAGVPIPGSVHDASSHGNTFEVASLPAVLCDLAQNFDNEKYPELVDRRWYDQLRPS